MHLDISATIWRLQSILQFSWGPRFSFLLSLLAERNSVVIGGDMVQLTLVSLVLYWSLQIRFVMLHRIWVGGLLVLGLGQANTFQTVVLGYCFNRHDRAPRTLNVAYMTVVGDISALERGCRATLASLSLTPQTAIKGDFAATMRRRTPALALSAGSSL